MRLNLSKDVDKGIFSGAFEFDNAFIFCYLIEKDNIIIDVGANIGFYTLLAAKKLKNSGIIYSFEPSKVAIQELQKNIELNKFRNVNVYDFALSDSSGKKEFYRCEDDAYNSLAANPMHKSVSKDIVDVITLDEFVKLNNIKKIDIIKIDAEGLDYSILKGSINSLKSFMPILFCEFNIFYLDENSRREFHNLLKEIGYEVFITKGHKFTLTIENFDLLNNSNSEIICFPKKNK